MKYSKTRNSPTHKCTNGSNFSKIVFIQILKITNSSNFFKTERFE